MNFNRTSAFVVFSLALLASCGKSEKTKVIQADLSQFSDFKDLDSAPEVLKKASLAVVKIALPHGAVGTGSFISPSGKLLTNNHVAGSDVCAKEGCYLLLSFGLQRGSAKATYKRVFAEPLQVLPNMDTAVLQIYETDSEGKKLGTLNTPEFLEFASESAKSLVGKVTHLIGHPNGYLKKISSGVVTQAVGLWFYSNLTSLPGNSGSPTLNEDGKIVGILHRSSGGSQSTLTAKGFNSYSVHSPSEEILKSLSQGLSADASSLLLASGTNPASAADVVKRADVYLNSGIAEVTIGDSKMLVMDILGAQCSTNLEQTAVDSLDTLDTLLYPCYQALDFMNCNSASNDWHFKSCPKASEKSTWLARFAAIAQKKEKFNGSVELFWLIAAPGLLESSSRLETKVSRDLLQKHLNEKKPAMSFDLAYYQFDYEVKGSGVDPVEFVKNYAVQPGYQHQYPTILRCLNAMRSADVLTDEELATRYADLMQDPNISLSAKMMFELAAFRKGFVK